MNGINTNADINTIQRTLAHGLSDITRHDSLIKKELAPKYESIDYMEALKSVFSQILLQPVDEIIAIGVGYLQSDSGVSQLGVKSGSNMYYCRNESNSNVIRIGGTKSTGNFTLDGTSSLVNLNQFAGTAEAYGYMMLPVNFSTIQPLIEGLNGTTITRNFLIY